jgi:hypothetical protein
MSIGSMGLNYCIWVKSYLPAEDDCQERMEATLSGFETVPATHAEIQVITVHRPITAIIRRDLHFCQALTDPGLVLVFCSQTIKFVSFWWGTLILWLDNTLNRVKRQKSPFNLRRFHGNTVPLSCLRYRINGRENTL